MSNYDLESIAETCGKASKTSKGWICCCPVHDDTNPSLSISENDGKLLVKCFAGCDPLDILATLRDEGAINSYAHSDSSFSFDSSSKNEYIQRIWQESVPAKGTLVEKYLCSRGYTGEIPASIRFHPCLKHAPSGKTLPAMVSGVTIYPSNVVTAIHRTYLSTDGSSKADVVSNKMMLGSVKGGAVMFGQRGGSILAVSEGIENALSLFLATGWPTWATLSASGMENIILPSIDDAGTLYIIADHDNRGLLAAVNLGDKEEVAGRNVLTIVPEQNGYDFNDILVMRSK